MIVPEKIPENTGLSPMITDETVQSLYEKLEKLYLHDACIILSTNELDKKNATQLYRGVSVTRWKNNPHPNGCTRHLAVFETFNAIPEYCFGCFKVVIQPHTVLELFKLMIMFQTIKLPNDNTRKCMIELRTEISGTYKGFIYCQSIEEGNEVLNAVKPLVRAQISADIPISFKRGCSEYSLAYPEFGKVEDNGKPLMRYREEWRKHEGYVDKALNRYILVNQETLEQERETYNKPFGLEDARKMRAWLSYAAALGDLSCLQISRSPLQWPDLHRPPFTQR